MLSETAHQYPSREDFFFFGRRDIISLLYKRLDAHLKGYRQNVAILGPLYIGKTFLITHFLKVLHSGDFLPFYFNVSDKSFHDFAKNYIQTICLTLKQNSYDINLMPKTNNLIQQIKKSLSRRIRKETFKRLFDIPEIIGKELNKKIVVVIDDFDKIDELNIKGGFVLLGKKIMIQKDVMYFLLSSSVEHSKNILNNDLALLFGKFEIVTLKHFDFLEAKLFVKEKLNGIRIDDVLLDFFTSFTFAHPFYLDVISDCLIRNFQDAKSIAKDDFFDVLNDVLCSQRGYLYQILLRKCEKLESKYGPDIIKVLQAVANGLLTKKDIAADINISRVKLFKLLDVLAADAIVSVNNSLYGVKDYIYKFWLKHVFKTSAGKEIPAPADRSETAFYGALRNMYSKHEYYYNNVMKLIVDLVKLFDGRKVKISGKNILLQQFDNVAQTDNEAFYKIRNILCEGESSWIIGVGACSLNETDILEFLRIAKQTGDIKKKIIICLNDIDTDMQVFAKQHKILLVDNIAINRLLNSYDMPLIVR